MTGVPIRQPSKLRSVGFSFCALVLLLVGCSSTPRDPMVAIEDFCSDPRIVVEMQRQDPKLSPMGTPWCAASSVAFRHDGEITEIAVAQVLRGYAQSWDMIWGVSDSIIRLPDDRLVNLGPNAPLPILQAGSLAPYLIRALDIEIVPRGTHELDRFYAAFLELTERGDCVSYEMKPPFHGQLSQCNRMVALSGDVSYLPGATTWQQARDMACGLVDSGSSRCPVYSMSLVAGARGQAIYVVELLVDAPAGSSATHQSLYYAIDAMTGVPTLYGPRLPGEPEIPLELIKGT